MGTHLCVDGKVAVMTCDGSVRVDTRRELPSLAVNASSELRYAADMAAAVRGCANEVLADICTLWDGSSCRSDCFAADNPDAGWLDLSIEAANDPKQQ